MQQISITTRVVTQNIIIFPLFFIESVKRPLISLVCPRQLISEGLKLKYFQEECMGKREAEKIEHERVRIS